MRDFDQASGKWIGYPKEYYRQGPTEDSGHGKAADAVGGILAGNAGRIGYLQQLISAPKPDILEAAKRKLIRSLVDEMTIVPEAYYSGLRDLVREYDPEWTVFFDGISGGNAVKQKWEDAANYQKAKAALDKQIASQY